MVSLIKYEFKSSARQFFPLYGILLAVCAFAGSQIASRSNWNGLMGVLLLVVFALIIATFVLTLVIVVRRFGGNLLGDEGYLMFTLPVKVEQLILSKMLVGTAWFALSSFVVGLGILLIVGGNLGELFDYLLYDFALINPLFVQNLGLYGMEAAVTSLLGSISSVLMLYAAIAVGHLSGKHRSLISFVAFILFLAAQGIVFDIANQIVFADAAGGALSAFSATGSLDNYDALLHTRAATTSVLSAGLSVVYFFIVRYILTHKLNLE